MWFRVHSIFQSNGDNIVDAKWVELGWEWNGKHLGGLLLWVNKSHARGSAEFRTYDMNAELSQSFFSSLILRGFLSVPSPVADTATIYNGSDDLSEALARSQKGACEGCLPKLASSWSLLQHYHCIPIQPALISDVDTG